MPCACHRRTRPATVEQAAAAQLQVTIFWLFIVLLLILTGSLLIVFRLVFPDE